MRVTEKTDDFFYLNDIRHPLLEASKTTTPAQLQYVTYPGRAGSRGLQ